MADSSHNNSMDCYSKYYFQLKDDSKKRYDNKPSWLLIKSSPSHSNTLKAQTLYGIAFQWHGWPDMMYPYVYYHLILILSPHSYMYINETAMCTWVLWHRVGSSHFKPETETGEIFWQRFSLESSFVDPVTSNFSPLLKCATASYYLN